MRTRIQLFEEELVFGTNGLLGEKEQARLFTEFAKDEIARVDKSNQQVAHRQIPHVVLVDGERDDGLKKVKPESRIVAKWNIQEDVVVQALNLLHNSGPHLTGDYRQSVIALVDGRATTDLNAMMKSEEIILVPTVAYARKIERGKGGYAPGHVYEAATAYLQSRYGNLATFKFTYESVTEGGTPIEVWARKHSAKFHPAKRAKQFRRDSRLPCIKIIL